MLCSKQVMKDLIINNVETNRVRGFTKPPASSLHTRLLAAAARQNCGTGSTTSILDSLNYKNRINNAKIYDTHEGSSLSYRLRVAAGRSDELENARQMSSKRVKDQVNTSRAKMNDKYKRSHGKDHVLATLRYTNKLDSSTGSIKDRLLNAKGQLEETVDYKQMSVDPSKCTDRSELHARLLTAAGRGDELDLMNTPCTYNCDINSAIKKDNLKESRSNSRLHNALEHSYEVEMSKQLDFARIDDKVNVDSSRENMNLTTTRHDNKLNSIIGSPNKVSHINDRLLITDGHHDELDGTTKDISSAQMNNKGSRLGDRYLNAAGRDHEANSTNKMTSNEFNSDARSRHKLSRLNERLLLATERMDELSRTSRNVSSSTQKIDEGSHLCDQLLTEAARLNELNNTTQQIVSECKNRILAALRRQNNKKSCLTAPVLNAEDRGDTPSNVKMLSLVIRKINSAKRSDMYKRCLLNRLLAAAVRDDVINY